MEYRKTDVLESPSEDYAMPNFVITANDVRSGRCVWLTAQKAWSTALGGIEPLLSESARDEALDFAREDQAHVCDPYVIEAVREGEVTVALSLRERIRALGPTV